MYLCTLEDVIGDLPVWLDDDLLNSSSENVAHITSCVLMLLFSCSGVLSTSWSSFFIGLVGRRFLNYWSILPCKAASLFDRFLLINLVVRDSHEVSELLRI